MSYLSLIQITKLSSVIVLLVHWISLECSPSGLSCPEIENRLWPETLANSCITSNPLCINEKQEISLRCCSIDGDWLNAPHCTNYQLLMDEMNPCPEGFYNTGSFCYTVIENSTYPPKCPNTFAVRFEDYIDGIDERFFPIWMPVQRDRSYGVGLFYWMEKGSRYKSYFRFCNDNCKFIVSTFGDDCVIYQNSTLVQTVSCESTYNAICVYPHLSDTSTKTLCSQQNTNCVQGDYFSPTQCLCWTNATNPDAELANFRISYQNLAYKALTNDECYIGLQKISNSYMWSDSHAINYTNWSPTAIFEPDYIYGLLSTDGWILSKEKTEYNCSLINKDISYVTNTANIILTYDEQSEIFSLHIISQSHWMQQQNNPFPEVLCFTDATATKLFERVEVINNFLGEDFANFSFHPLTNQSGYYWCEGFLFPNLDVMASKKYLLRTTEEEYVLTVSSVFADILNPLTEEYLQHLQDLLRTEYLDTEASYFTPRIFGVTQIYTQNSTMKLIFHLSSTLNKADKINYGLLQNILSNLKNFKYETFLSADRCIGFQLATGNKPVTWPTVNIGQILESAREGYCLNGTGAIVHMRCVGDFIYGADWLSPTEGCADIVDGTNATVNLTSILDMGNPEFYIVAVNDIINRYDLYFNEIELITKFLEQLLDRYLEDSVWSLVIDSLLNVSKEILDMAQTKYNCIERILICINILAKKLDSFEVYRSNLAILSKKPTKNLSFISWKEIEAIYELELHYLNENNESTNLSDFNIQINIPEDQLNAEYITVIVFKQPNFFTHDGFYKNYFTPVFRINYWDNVDETDMNMLTVIYNKQFRRNSICSLSELGDTLKVLTSQTLERKILKDDGSIVCQFPLGKYFGVINVNVTKMLENVMFENIPALNNFEIISEILTKYHDFFEPIDVEYILNISTYALIGYSPEVVHRFLMVVDELMNIDLDVLKNAEQYYNSSSKLLVLTSKALPYLLRPQTENDYIFANIFVSHASFFNHRYREILIQCKTECDNSLLVIAFNKNIFNIHEDYKHSSKIVGIFYLHDTEGPSQFVNVVFSLEGRQEVTDVVCLSSSGETWSNDTPKTNNSRYNCDILSGYVGLFYNVFNVTNALEQIYHTTDPPETYLEDTLSIIRKYKDLIGVYDIYVITQIFSKFENDKNIDGALINLCIQIVDSFQDIDRSTIVLAQESYESSQDITSSFWCILAKINSAKETQGQNLLVVSYDIDSTFRGINVENCHPVCDISIIKQGDVIHPSEELNTDNATLVFSQKLVDDIMKIKKINNVLGIFVIFFNNVLFITDYVEEMSQVYMVQMTNFANRFNDRLTLTVNTTFEQTENLSFYCALFTENGADWTNNVIQRKQSSLCHYYQQGYYTILQTNFTPNVTGELENLKDDQKISFSEKLYRLESLTNYYDIINESDLYMITRILEKTTEIDEEDLNIYTSMFNNILRIEREILKSAQNNFNVLSEILENLNTLTEKFPADYSNTDGRYFNLLICETNSSNSVTIGKSSAFCNTKSMLDSELNGMIMLTFCSPGGGVSIEECIQGKFLLSIFRENSFFATEFSHTSTVIGFSTFPLITSPNNLYISFEEIFNYPNPARCGYWDFMSNQYEYGIWWTKSANNMSQNWIHCKYRTSAKPKFYALMNNYTMQPVNLSHLFRNIRDDKTDPPGKIESTRYALQKYILNVESTHISLISQILIDILRISREDLEDYCSIINSLMYVSRPVLKRSQQHYNATDYILRSLEKIASLVEFDSYQCMLKNFVLLITKSKAGIIYDDSTEIPTIRTIDHISMIDFENQEEMQTGIYLEDSLQKQLQTESLKLFITFFFDDHLFNDEFMTSTTIPGNVVGLTLSKTNIEPKGSFWVYDNSNFNKNQICAVWNYEMQKGSWEREGKSEKSRCESKALNYIAILEDENLNVTNTLENILESTASVRTKLKNVNAIISEKTSELRSIDIHLISKIMVGVQRHQTVMKHMTLITRIVSGLLQVNRKVLHQSQMEYNATDRILHNVDQMALTVQHIKTDIIVHDFFTIGFFNLKKTNITGIKLSTCLSRVCSITTLHNESFENLDPLYETETAVILSKDLIQQIHQSNKTANLIVTVFSHNALFNEENREASTSLILGIIITGIGNDLRGDVYTVYNTKNMSDYHINSCAHWKYQMSSNNVSVRGFWKTDMEPSDKDSTTFCKYNHLTHLALLLASNRDNFIDPLQDNVLDIITKVNCFLSLVGIVVIMLTAVLFEKWRQNTGNQILINFSIAISIKIVMLYISELVDRKTQNKVLCYVSGAVLHYSVLSEFCWMLIIAILQFKRFVEVLGGPPKYIILKSCICGWILPSFPVFCILILDIDNYLQSSLGICYPSGLGLHLGVWLPLMVIITINFIIFLFIIYNVFHKKTEFKDQINYEILFQWRLALLLFSMLGLTWFFGFISLIKDTIVFVYLFCFTASLQGFIMFLFFIVFNKSTRYLYSQSLKSFMYINGYNYH